MHNVYIHKKTRHFHAWAFQYVMKYKLIVATINYKYLRNTMLSFSVILIRVEHFSAYIILWAMVNYDIGCIEVNDDKNVSCQRDITQSGDNYGAINKIRKYSTISIILRRLDAFNRLKYRLIIM